MTVPIAALLANSVVLQAVLLLGAALGLYLLLRGLSALKGARGPAQARAQNAPQPNPGVKVVAQIELAPRPAQKIPPRDAATPHATAIDTPSAGNDSAQIVNLSAGFTLPDSAALMTQQGKIAAALQRAQQENPARWSAFEVPSMPALMEAAWERDETGTETPADKDNGAKPSANGERVELADVPRAGVPRTVKATVSSSRRKPSAAPRWRPALLLWGGSALTLLCLCLLAMQWRWL